MMDSIKILVSYHKPGVILQSDIMMPIEVGAALHSNHLGFVRDDEGENISSQNPTLCELTAQYWAWKNLDADYYGFMHYRRHLIFKDYERNIDATGVVFFPLIDDEYKENVGLDDDIIRAVVSDFDIILPPVIDVSCWGTVSNEVQFSSLSNLHAKDFDMVCKVVCELYPEFQETVDDFRTGHLCYWFNMYVMKRELFMDYSSWLFTILEEADHRMDYSGYDSQEKRSLAFMAERLFSIYIIHLMKEKQELKVKHLPITFVVNTDWEMDRKSVQYPEPISYEDRFTQMITSVHRAYEEMKTIGRANVLTEMLIGNSKPFSGMEGAGYLFYGAGDNCHLLLKMFRHLGWSVPEYIWDINANIIKTVDGIPVNVPWKDDLPQKDIVIIITVLNSLVAKEVRDHFERFGYYNIVFYNEVMHDVSQALWMRIDQDEKI